MRKQIMPHDDEQTVAGCKINIPLENKKRGFAAANSHEDNIHNKQIKHAKITHETDNPEEKKPRVALIVPFQDCHKEQNRLAHLEQFIPYITAFLSKHGLSCFHIFVMEQIDEGRKFNKGKLLNAGFNLTKDEYDVFIFHDVDLLPSDDLAPWYTAEPVVPCHIARVWDRYNGNKKYFGGVVSFNKQDFLDINGYPNNFWGWGGEDDEMYNRVKRFKTFSSPDKGSFKDLESMSLKEKLDFIRDKKWKCMVKWQLLKESKKTWMLNGLTNLNFKEVSRENLGDNCSKISINLGNNNHWSDPKISKPEQENNSSNTE